MKENEIPSHKESIYSQHLANVRREFAEHMVKEHGGKTTSTCHSCIGFRDTIKWLKKLQEASV